MSTRAQVLSHLADQDFHSGTEIGAALGISRAAINKAVQTLQSMGIEIHSVTGKGYRMVTPVHPIAADKLHHYLGAHVPGELHVLDEVDSTSAWLLGRSRERSVHGSVCIADCQSEGRGRRGRHWVAPPYRNLMFSMAWELPQGPGDLGGLSLAAGLAVVRALEQEGITGLKLKWPNDILHQDRKLAGLLVDIRGEATGPVLVVLGVGINVHVPVDAAGEIDQPWCDLAGLCQTPPERNRLAATLLQHLAQMFTLFAVEGFAVFHEDWRRYHAHHQSAVRLTQGDQVWQGVAVDVDASGGLLVADEQGRVRCFHSGEVSLRPASR